MPVKRNTHGGKKYKKKKHTPIKYELEFKEENQDYALVTDILGNSRVRVKCLTDITFKSKSVIGIIRGKMRKRVWINKNDIVLISFREYQTNKVDIIGKYSDEDIRNLILYGELPEKDERAEDNNHITFVNEDNI